MSSSINITIPTSGLATTQSVRDNFAIIKTEIEALQELLVPTYLCISSHASLTNERILAVTSPLTKTDSGAGGNLTIALGYASPLSVVSGNLTLAAGAITEDLLDIYSTPTDGYFLGWSTAKGKLDYIAASVSAHDLLSATHSDTVTASPVAGDIIYANATPAWTKLAKSTDGRVLTLVSGYPAWVAAPTGRWIDGGNYIYPDNNSRLSVGDSATLAQPTIYMDISVNDGGGIGSPSYGHIALYSHVERIAGGTYTFNPHFFYYEPQVLLNYQDVNTTFYTFCNAASGGGSSSTTFSTWNMCIGPTGGTGRVIGQEINVEERRGVQSHINTGVGYIPSNSSVGLALVPETGFSAGDTSAQGYDGATTGYDCTSALFIGKSAHTIGGLSPKWKTGICIARDSIVPTVDSPYVNEAIYLGGASSTTYDYIGLYFDNYFRSGLYLYNATFENNKAIVMGGTHRIYWGSGTSECYLNKSSQDLYWYDGTTNWKLNQSSSSTSLRFATKVIAAYNSLDVTNADYICDGTADQVQIQAAIDAIYAQGQGGKIQLMEGDYYISATINLYNGIEISGIGFGFAHTDQDIVPGTTLYLVANVEMFTGNGGSGHSVWNLTFNNITFCGRTQTASEKPPTGTGIRNYAILNLLNCREVTLEDCLFWKCAPALYCDSIWDLNCRNVSFSQCGTGATTSTSIVVLYNGTYDACNQIAFDTCRWEFCGGHSVLTSGGEAVYVSFTDCKFEPDNYSAIYGTFWGLRIHGCHFHNTAGYNMVHILNGSSVGAINGNVFENNAAYNMIYCDGDWINISGNCLHNNLTPGSFYGVELGVNSNNCRCIGNSGYNAGGALFHDSGTSNTLADNDS